MTRYITLLVVKKIPKSSQDFRAPPARNPETLFRYNFVVVDTLRVNADVLRDPGALENLENEITEEHGPGAYSLRHAQGRRCDARRGGWPSVHEFEA